MIPIVMPMFSKIWNANIASTPTHTSVPKKSRRQQGGSPGPPHQRSRTGASSGAAADEAELLTHHGEDEVGVLLGHVPQLGLGALEQALRRANPPAPMAVFDWSWLYAARLGLVAGIEEGREPIHLVLLQHPDADDGVRCP